ncbi:PqiC family protein [Acidomonas methanolica]|uniref:ABC-type transport auxiliary lipoprotein component domain-containing protein n=1 Tax=Acidomonas methanolica NBRC 104435 TaxID=1231351 RepID=A0A023D559_ACIMT|nr:PqiC family protein [Acidomonas methanolica]MBU2654304.1 PqiC family protein [Acidomonas methanolica]TCS29257.1 hypothetical protein EDC31_10726 [Acidomonas methanolica]GAJ28946.1 hypothetical protein Amme_040_018 [Acidomonas methanolica NBRC 104435]GBQ49590.1 hypothetical protein AA0498_1018 [Acidomonas methanolica]GEK99279.1 hypothetical protein AME01nite_17780 [Acidomonas methanolica NBRC 104435]
MLPEFSKGRLSLALIAMGCGLAGCNADPTLYDLAPVAGSAQAGGPAVVEVRTPVVAQSLDRDEIVRQNRDYRLKIAKGDAWSAPLGALLGRTLAIDLAGRLPGSTVFAQNDAVAATPMAYVEVTVTAFNEDQQGNARLEGMLSVHRAGGEMPVVATPVQLRTTLDTRDTAHLVAALSAMTGTLADQAASKIRSLPTTP